MCHNHTEIIKSAVLLWRHKYLSQGRWRHAYTELPAYNGLWYDQITAL